MRRSSFHPRPHAPVLAILLTAGVSGLAAQETGSFEVPAWEGGWYKGNTHAHTTESDGDSSPETVARWYRDHGYDFLVLSDHNVFTDPATLAEVVGERFLLIPGEELTSGFDGRPVHVNGLNIPGVVAPRRAETLVGTIQANVDAVREVDGVPHINHPNFGWAFGAEELAQVRDDRLIEIFNGHPHVNNLGGGGTPGLEEVWDALLTGGMRIYGIAVDDAHHFQGEFSAHRSNPGRGWVAVRAPRLEPGAIVEALEAGHFYASTGVTLDDVVVMPHRLEVHIERRASYRYTTEFIGGGGRVLKTTGDNPAIFDLDDPTTPYVRARVVSSRGDVAWVQPIFVRQAAAPPGRDARGWVEQTLASLTLREKVGQLIMPGTGGEYVASDTPEMERLIEWVEEQGIGGISLSIGLPHSYAAKLNALQSRARVPLLVTANMEAGPGQRLAGVYSLPHVLPQGGGTRFPPAMALGATGSDSLAFELGRVTGLEARAVGVHLTFSPVADVNSNAANPIINTRALGGSPELVARLGGAFIRGARAAGLMTTAKHFPGHGDTEDDSHIDLPVLAFDRARLDSIELPPFRAAVRAGVDAVMTAHIAVTGVEGADAPPATLSHHFLTDVLREQLGFQGLIITDAMEMGAITRRYGDVEALLLALEAGADVLLKPLDVGRAVAGIEAAVRSGRIPESRLDASVRRILEAKARLGLPEGAQVDLAGVDERVGVAAHRRLAEEVARRSITLARDERGLVPLRAGARVLSVTYAEAVDLTAGRAFDRELAGGGVQVERARVGAGTSPAEWAALAARAEAADVVIASAYVSPREHLGTVAVGGGMARFVSDLAGRGAPVVAVSFGSPYMLAAFPTVPGYMLAWGGAEVSQRAAARALLGRAPITGRLPVSLAPWHPLGAGLRRELP